MIIIISFYRFSYSLFSFFNSAFTINLTKRNPTGIIRSFVAILYLYSFQHNYFVSALWFNNIMHFTFCQAFAALVVLHPIKYRLDYYLFRSPPIISVTVATCAITRFSKAVLVPVLYKSALTATVLSSSLMPIFTTSKLLF